MLASRLAIRSSLVFSSFRGNSSNLKLANLTYRNLQTQSRENAGVRKAIRSKFNESASSQQTPLSTTPLALGQGLIAGASVLGLGALAYYGLGRSDKSGILDKSAMWPQLVRDRISSTYKYVGASLGVTALSVVGILRTPALMNLAMRSSLMATFVSIGLAIGSGMVVRSIPYDDSKVFGTKQAAWALHCALLGAMICPLTILGGPMMLRAAWYTAGIVGGLSLIATTAPSEKFLNMAGPLSIGLGVVFASSVGSMFLPPTTRLGLSLYSLSLYGGLVLFSMFLLYDTQKIVHHAETRAIYDPVNESISIYLDILNIFIRMATILSGGGNRRK